MFRHFSIKGHAFTQRCGYAIKRSNILINLESQNFIKAFYCSPFFFLQLTLLNVIADFINESDENHSRKNTNRKIVNDLFNKRAINI